MDIEKNRQLKFSFLWMSNCAVYIDKIYNNSGYNYCMSKNQISKYSKLNGSSVNLKNLYFGKKYRMVETKKGMFLTIHI